MIIKKINTKNFKILKDFTWELNEGINLIYGDNASGKSTLIEIFEFLDEVFTKESNIKAELSQNPFVNPNFVNPSMFAINRALYERYKTIGTKNHIPIEIEIEYLIDGTKYKYEISIEKDDLVSRESLSFIDKKKKEINIFKRLDKKGNYEGVLIDEINESGQIIGVTSGNNSIVSRIMYLVDWGNFNSKGINSINKFNHLISGFAMINKYNRGNEIYVKHLTLTNGDSEQILIPFQSLSARDKQDIKFTREKMTNQAKRFYKVASEFDPNIVDVGIDERTVNKNNANEFMAFNDNGNFENVEFVMQFVKMIDNKEERIDFNIESNGTKAFIKYFRVFEIIFNKSNKKVTLFDGFGANLHDALTKNIFVDIAKAASKRRKQVIFTTHCSDLLNINESWFGNKNKYILTNNHSKIKIKNLVGTDVKENNKMKYLNGAYQGNSSLMNTFEIEDMYE